jgi:hypothetical protein
VPSPSVADALTAGQQLRAALARTSSVLPPMAARQEQLR